MTGRNLLRGMDLRTREWIWWSLELSPWTTYGYTSIPQILATLTANDDSRIYFPHNRRLLTNRTYFKTLTRPPYYNPCTASNRH